MWVLGLLACEGEPTRAKTRVQGQDSAPTHSGTESTPVYASTVNDRDHSPATTSHVASASTPGS